MTFIIRLITLFTFCISNAQHISPTEYFISQIKQIENSIEKGTNSDLSTIRGIVCLTGIETEKVDGSYIGYIYYPNKNDIQKWKNWFRQNKDNIAYYVDGQNFAKEIYNENIVVLQVKLDTGDFRNSLCLNKFEMQDIRKLHNRK